MDYTVEPRPAARKVGERFFRAEAERLFSAFSAAEGTCFLATTEPYRVEALPAARFEDIVNLARVNNVASLNAFFAAVNHKLEPGGVFTGCVQTAAHVKKRVMEGKPKWLAWPYYTALFVAKRVLPKLKLTRALYRRVTKGRNRIVSKTEVLGRLVYCGFEIVDYHEVHGELYFTVRKVGAPKDEATPSYGPVFKMRRIGQGGAPVDIYKLRTMHPYAEYLQAYVYVKNDLRSNGKFKDDFRIATWGRFLRKVWLDELPMLFNLLKGDIKLVGVRPISQHYMSLYPEELLEKRLRCKPGLLPPFYADLPEGFDAIIESERRYLEAYERNPIKTDARYLLRILHTIVVRRARSQ